MKVRITSHNFIVPFGTIMDVGEAPPRAWHGKYEGVGGMSEPESEPERELDIKASAWRKPKPG